MQARKLQRESGIFHESEILVELPGKASARDVETKLIQNIRKAEGNQALPGNRGIH